MDGADRIVVRGPNWLGDQVLAMDFYAGLRAHYPKAYLVWLGPQGSWESNAAALFDDCLFVDGARRRHFGYLRQLAERLAAYRFDLSFSLPASYSSHLPFAMAKIPHRVGFTQSGSSLLLTDGIRWPGRSLGQHKAQVYLNLLEFVSGSANAVRWQNPNCAIGPKKKLILVAPGASIALREWPYLRECLLGLREDFPEYEVFAVGSSADQKWSSLLRRWNISGVQDWIGKTSLEQLKLLCEQAALVIATDSGVAHVAARWASAPTLVLFGPGDPGYVLPRGGNSRAIHCTKLDCWPCESATCHASYGYQRCLKEISPEQVVREAAQVLYKGNNPNYNFDYEQTTH